MKRSVLLAGLTSLVLIYLLGCSSKVGKDEDVVRLAYYPELDWALSNFIQVRQDGVLGSSMVVGSAAIER